MERDLRELPGVQFPGLVQDLRRDEFLPDIVQERRQSDLPDRRFGEIQAGRLGHHHDADVEGVGDRVVVAGLEADHPIDQEFLIPQSLHHRGDDVPPLLHVPEGTLDGDGVEHVLQHIRRPGEHLGGCQPSAPPGAGKSAGSFPWILPKENWFHGRDPPASPTPATK